MNKVYYKGYLYELSDSYECSSANFEKEMKKICSDKDNEDIGALLRNYWMYDLGERGELTYPLLIDKLNQVTINAAYMTRSVPKICGQKLIFEVIKDENNIEYAREIFSNKIFPLIKKTDIEARYTLSNVKAANANSNIYERRGDFVYDILIKYSCKKENILKLDNFFYLPVSEVASPYEINYYLERQCKTPVTFFSKPKPDKSLLKILINFSNSNAFQSEIIEKQEETPIREKQDKITLYMEKIEFLLLRLNEINHEVAEEKQKKYDKLKNSCNEELTISPLNVENLKRLQAEIEFAIEFDQKSNNTIIDALDNIINEYNSFNKTSKTISDIDELVKLFLQMKSNYSPVIQRNAIEKFSLIYIYELYENRDTIDINSLGNSYINDMLPTIVICLKKLINNNEIENNIIIKLEGDITLQYIMSCIKEMKFTKNKELIK